MTDDLEGLWKMKHVAASHVGSQQLLQEEISEDVTVLISVILEPEVERQSGGQPDVGPVAHRGDHRLPPDSQSLVSN